MILKDWLKINNENIHSFAKKNHFGLATIYKSIAGTRKVSVSTAVKISKATKGQVTKCEALFPEDYQFGE